MTGSPDITHLLEGVVETLARLEQRFAQLEQRLAPQQPPSAGSSAAEPEFSAEDIAGPEARTAHPTHQVQETERKLAELEENLRATKSAIEEKSAELNGLEASLANARQTLSEAAEHSQKVAELDARAAEVARYQKTVEAVFDLAAKLWPDWLRTGQLAPWRKKLEHDAFSSEATSAAALLFAAVHGYNAAQRDPDPKLLHDNLREVSRRLFPWLREQGHDETGALEVAAQWAAAINEECQGRGEVELPTLGAPATNQWMIFRPRPGVNDVLSVQTWCVRNAQKQPIHRAEVTV